MTLKEYKKYVSNKLALLKPVFAKASIGDFSENVNIPDEDDEFTEFFVGIQLILEVVREQMDELQSLNESLESKIQERTAELIQKHRLLHEAERIARLGSWEWDISANKISWSHEMYNIYGLTPAGFKATLEGFLEGVHLEDRPYAQHAIENALKNKKPFSFQYRVVRPDGKVRNLLASGKVVTDKKGKPVKVVGTGQDITKMKKAEEALHKQQELYKTLLQVQSEMGEGVAITEGEKVIYVNDALCSIYGYSREEFLALSSFLDVIASGERKKLSERLHGRLKEKEAVDFGETIALHKKGHPIHIAYSLKIVQMDNRCQVFSIIQDITERKAAEEKISGLAAMVSASQDAIVGKTLAGVITSWNYGAEQMYGYAAEEMIGQPASRLMPASQAAELNQILSRVRRGEYIDRFETLHIRKDGKQLYVSSSEYPIKDAAGKVIGIAGIHRDVTKLKRTELKLKESEELHRTVLESISEGLIITDNDDRVIYVNPRMEELCGYTRQEIKGKIAHKLLHSEPHHEEMQNRMLHRLAGIDESYEIWMKKKDETFFYAEVRSAPYRNSEGKIIGTVNSVMDITSKKHEQELEKLAVAATQSFNSVMIADQNGKIEWVNNGFTQLTGYYLEDVKNTSGEILRRGDITGLNKRSEYYEKVVKSQKAISYESKNYTRAGKEYWTVTTLTPMLNASGEVEKIIAIDTDISEQKKLEEELRVANKIAEHSLMKGNKAMDELMKAKRELERTMKAKEKFLANMSHEIRTPMNGIIGLTDLLLKTGLTDKQREYLTAIKSSGDTLLVVINDILDISKMEAGKMKFDEQPFSIAEIMDYLDKIFTPKVTQKNLQLKKKMDTNIPYTLMGDSVRLSQILMNLLSNAVKFTDKGFVQLSAGLYDEDDYSVVVQFTVEDTGRGIPEDKTSAIFLDFTQVDADKMRNVEGTGLGLAITKRLVELQGGNIKVESKVNQGSKFTATLKFRKCKDEKQLKLKQKIKEEPAASGNLEGLKILLVEDNLVNIMLAEQILVDWGCLVDKAENGKEAIEKLSERDYNIVLMDIKMPVMDGYEAAYYIRTKMPSPKCNIPILALTAHAATWEAEKCIEAGMNDYVTKPFNIADLQRKIQQVVSNRPSAASAPTPTMAENSFNLSYLQNISKGNKSFELKMLQTFVEQTSAEMQKIQKAFQNQEWDLVSASAHKIKPSFHFVGALETEELLKQIEEQARSKTKLEQMPELIAKFMETCQHTIAYVKTEIEKYMVEAKSPAK